MRLILDTALMLMVSGASCRADQELAPPAVESPIVERAASEPEPKPEPHAPTLEESLACRAEHCNDNEGAKACFAVCARRSGGSLNPPRHERCNDRCQEQYGLSECFEVCDLDRRAFSTAFSPDHLCERELLKCRVSCSSGIEAKCELGCMTELRSCERAESPP